MRLLSIIYLTGLLSPFVSCEEDGIPPSSESELVSIRYGTSFGFCLGYCNRDLTINSTQTRFEKYGREDTVQTIVCQEVFTSAEWSELSAQINLPLFAQLDTILGCPDCADGGAEYIELQSISSHHRVSFEYNHEPEEVKSFIALLRKMLLDFEDCGD